MKIEDLDDLIRASIEIDDNLTNELWKDAMMSPPRIGKVEAFFHTAA